MKTKDRRPITDDRRQKTEGLITRDVMWKDDGQETEGLRMEDEDRRPRTEDGRQKAEA